MVVFRIHCIAVLLILLAAHAAGDDFASQLPRIMPTDPSQTAADFQVAEGYQIQLIASEPLIATPVEVQWDAEGAMFVCEMRGYSEHRDEKLSRVSRLVDTDDDGIYDAKTVFADQLLWPTAIFPYDGGLFVADAPHVYYFQDTDGDGVADRQTTVLTGFSTSNVQGLVNSFRWGLDHRIHLACGTAGGRVRRFNDHISTAVDVRGHDLAFDPRDGSFERTSGGAQHGMCFDDWGRKFVSSNSDHLQQVMYEKRYFRRGTTNQAPPSRLSIATDGPQAEVYRISPVEPWRKVRTRLRVAGLVGGPVEGGGRATGYFTGATGVTIYRGDAWPQATKGQAIVGDVGSQLIHRKLMTQVGVPFSGSRMDKGSELVASRDIWFRPAQFACGPDGALTVVDVYREVIEHPKSLPPEIKRHLDLNAGRDRGRIYRIVPNGYKHRVTPNLMLASTPELVQLLAHSNAWHRETAARLLFQRQDDSAVPELKHLLRTSPSALGRMHAMYALQGLASLDAEDLFTALGDADPNVIRHALRCAESQPEFPRLEAVVAALLNHPSLELRYQLAFSLGQWSFQKRADYLAQILLQTPRDRWIQAAVLSSAAGQAAPLLIAMMEGAQTPLPADLVNQLVASADRETLSLPQATSVLQSLLAGDPDLALLESLQRLSPQVSQSLADQTQQRIDSLVQLALAVAEDQSSESRVRVQAVQRLSNLRSSRERIADRFVRLLQRPEPIELEIALIDAIKKLPADDAQHVLLQRWPSWSPAVRRRAIGWLLADATRVDALLTAIEGNQIDHSDVPLASHPALVGHRDAALARRAKAIFQQKREASREAVVQRYQVIADLTGDHDRGRVVFQKQCAACHQLGELGHAIGPNLFAAVTRGADSILVNVMDPNREVNPQYLQYNVLTIGGRVISGMIVSETANSLTLTVGEGQRHVIANDQIERIKNTQRSIMPEGFETSITPQGMADLIEFLSQAAVAKPDEKSLP